MLKLYYYEQMLLPLLNVNVALSLFFFLLYGSISYDYIFIFLIHPVFSFMIIFCFYITPCVHVEP